MGHSANPGNKGGETPETERLVLVGWIKRVIGKASSWVGQTGCCFVLKWREVIVRQVFKSFCF